MKIALDNVMCELDKVMCDKLEKRMQMISNQIEFFYLINLVTIECGYYYYIIIILLSLFIIIILVIVILILLYIIALEI